MFLKPRWFRMLRHDCRPPAERVERLETIRKRHNIWHDLFALKIASSPSITRRFQRQLLAEVRAKVPAADKKELWNAVLTFSLENLIRRGFESPAILEDTDRVVSSANSFDDVCDYIISLNKKAAFADTVGIGQMIDSILEEKRTLA